MIKAGAGVQATVTLSVKVGTTSAEARFEKNRAVAGKAVDDATAIAAEVAGDKLTASTEATLKAEADAIKAIEANSAVTVELAFK